MRLGLVAAPLLISATAYAQAPGQVDPTPVPEPSYEQTPVVENPCSGYRDVMRHRFGVGLNLGGFSAIAGEDEMETETKFRTAELAIRYRVSPRFELELVIGGGRQVLDDGNDGDLAMGGGTLGARYRFRPGRAWDWWLGAGLGATVIEAHQSTEEQRDAATRPHVAFSIGLERRWTRFAIHADARMMAIGPREDQAGETVVPGPRDPRLPVDARTAEELTAGVFTLGASFHF